MKKAIIIIIIVLLVLGIGIYFIVANNNTTGNVVPDVSNTTSDLNSTNSTTDNTNTPVSNNTVSPNAQLNTINNTTPSTAAISISNFAFSPSSITVLPGTKVTWTNNDSVAHTIISDSDNLLNSQNIEPGDTFSYTFTTPGTTAYHCSIHPSMTGTITVQPQNQ